MENENIINYKSFPIEYWEIPDNKELRAEKDKEYRSTDVWKNLESVCLDKLGGRCALCKSRATVAHHAVWKEEYFGSESVNDLTPLCTKCHRRFHNPYATLDKIRVEVGEEARKQTGISCPVCRQYVKYYKRKLNATMGRTMIYLYRCQLKNPNDSWIHIPTQFLDDPDTPMDIRRGREYPRLGYWGLLETNSKKGTGYYQITELGVKFVLGEVKIPDYLVIHNNVVMDKSTTLATITDCLGSKFNYADLMSTSQK